MANKIILKKSSVASKVPLATDLEVGELAVNLADAKLYSKNASGTVISVGGGSGSGDVAGPSSATDNALARFDGTTGKLIQNSIATLDDSGNMDTVTSKADAFDIDTTATPAAAVGRLSWDDGNGTAQLGMKGGNVTLQLGEELLARVYNDSGVALTDGQIVYISGAQGNRIAVKLAKADSETTSAGTLGMVTEPIAIGAEGFITVVGTVNKLNTTGLTAGALVYLSATTAGAYTTTPPTAPNHRVTLGYVERVDNIVGSIYVKVDNGYELDELHNVLITSPTSGNTLIYDASAGVWKNANLTDGTGITITEAAGSITIANAGVTSLTGTANEIDVSASTGAITLSLPATINANTTGNAATATSAGKWTTARTLSFTGDATGSGSVDGSANVATALTLANTAVTAGSYTNTSLTVDAKGRITAASSGTAPVTSVGATAPIASSGGATPTISITQASSTTNGYLSSTDWNTFNNKTSNTGTVTSVAMTVPTGLSVSGTPITTSGTFALTMTAGYSIPTTASQTNWDSAYTQRLQWDGGSTNLVAATGRTSLGGTTVGQNFFTLTNPAAITFPRINADNSVSALDVATFRTAIGAGTSSTTGTVTSVSGTGTVSGLSLSGTVTTSGNITLGGTLAVTPSNFASQTANTFLAAPNGTAGTPTFRSIVAADIPTLNQNTTGTASNVTGTVAIANGGTGATSAAAALTALGAQAAATAITTSNIASQSVNYATSAGNADTLDGQHGAYYQPASTAITTSNIGSQSVNYATSSGSTSYAAFSGDSVSKDNITTRTDSGFYESSTGTTAEGWPVNDSGWQHMIACTHSNDSNYYSMQIGGSFFDNTFYGRKTNGSGTTGWVQFLTSGNYNSYSPTLTGTGASGTWGINISGNAATASNGGVTSVNGLTGAVTLATGGFDAGTVMLFRQTAAPTGWTKDTTNYNDSAIRVVTGTVSSGGSVGFTTAFASQAVSGTIANTTATGTLSGGAVAATTLTTAQLASHSHSYTARNDGSPGNYGSGGAGSAFGATTGAAGSNGSHTHSFTQPTFTGTAHNHTFTGTAINMAVKYCDVIFATKN